MLLYYTLNYMTVHIHNIIHMYMYHYDSECSLAVLNADL